MMQIEARQLLRYSTEELEEILTGRFILKFDNGETLETNAIETYYSSFVWDILRFYDKSPILPQHHVGYHLRKKTFSSKTTNGLYNAHLRSVYGMYLQDPLFSRNEFMRKIYQVNNKLYNVLIDKTLAWAGSLDVLDFIEVLENKEILDIRATMEVTPEGVDKAQAEIVNVLKTAPALNHNVLANGVRSGSMSDGQVVKCIGFIGWVTDLDSHIFNKKPILRNYTEGMRLFYDSMIESRSGAKALHFSKKPLQDTEYFSRRLQLNTMNLQHLHYGDCGSDSYLHWLVETNDLPALLGAYYLDEESKQLKEIEASDEHLIGQVLKLRNPLRCNHPDPYGICSTCFGALSYGIPENANIGQMCAVTEAERRGQKILSIKHLDTSAVVESVYVAPIDRQFLKIADGGNSYKLNNACIKLKPKIIIPNKAAKMLAQLMDIDDVRKMNIGRTTEIAYIQIEHYAAIPRKGEDESLMTIETRTIPISIKRRMGGLTHEFLQYMKEHGWSYNTKRDFVVDISDWDFNQLFITLPMKHHNVADYSQDIAKLVEGRIRNKKGELLNTNPDDLLQELFSVVNDGAVINIAILSVIVYTTMITNGAQYNYNLPKQSTGGELGIASQIMSHRSLSAAFAYENHAVILNDPINFLIDDRPNHVFDAIVVPELM